MPWDKISNRLPGDLKQMASCEMSALQNTAVDSAVVAEMKVVGSADCNQPSCTEPTAKPPPFKDPSFMVSLSFHVSLSLFFSKYFCLSNQFPLLEFFLGHGSTLGLVGRQQVKRTGLGKTSNRFWPWSELCRGSWTIQTVSHCVFMILPFIVINIPIQTLT